MSSSESDRVERFVSLVDTLPECDEGLDHESAHSTDDLVFGFLLWESTLPRAKAAFRQLKTQLVDVNELRVCLPADFAVIVGPKYPKAAHRSRRIRSVLNDLFHRHNAVTLDHTRAMPAADLTEYLTGLNGMHRFVVSHLSARQAIPAFPVDELLIKALRKYQIIEVATVKRRDRAAWIEKWIISLIPENLLHSTHIRLRNWLASIESELAEKPRRSRKTAPANPDKTSRSSK